MAHLYHQYQPCSQHGYPPTTQQPGYPTTTQHPGYSPITPHHSYPATTQQPSYSPNTPHHGYPATIQQPAQHPGYPTTIHQPTEIQPNNPCLIQNPCYSSGSVPTAPLMATGDQWMPRPIGASNCPSGLEYLTNIDQLIVDQEIDLLKVFTSYEENNRYAIKNSVGQNVFYAVEETGSCTRDCCGPTRPFDIRILDNMQREVLQISRPFRCSSCCFPCYMQELTVQTPSGKEMGYIIQKWSLLAPSFEVTDNDGNPILLIEGPMCTFSMGRDVEFKVLSLDGRDQVGRITKQWGGYIKETYTDADTFSITFPMNLDVKAKATLLGACFLIDFMFFESSTNRDEKSKGNQNNRNQNNRNQSNRNQGFRNESFMNESIRKSFINSSKYKREKQLKEEKQPLPRFAHEIF